MRTLRAKAVFLRHFASCGNVLRSCQAAKIGRRTVYDWLAEDPQFKTLRDAAHEDALDLLEDEATRRAYHGVLKPIYQGGRKVGSVREYSDTLMMLLLKGKRPETFRERHEHTGKNGEPIESTVSVAVIDAARASLKDKLTQLAMRAAANASVAHGGAPA